MTNIPAGLSGNNENIRAEDWRHRIIPYDLLVAQAAHSNDMAMRTKKVAALAARVARDLLELARRLDELDTASANGPIDRLRSRVEKMRDAEAREVDATTALLRALRGEEVPREQTTDRPRPSEKESRGSIVSAIIKIPRGLSQRLQVEARSHTALRAYYRTGKLGTFKGGAPGNLVFRSGCKILAELGLGEKESAKELKRARLAAGAPTKIAERVRVTLNRHAGDQSKHPFVGPLESLWKEFWRIRLNERTTETPTFDWANFPRRTKPLRRQNGFRPSSVRPTVNGTTRSRDDTCTASPRRNDGR